MKFGTLVKRTDKIARLVVSICAALSLPLTKAQDDIEDAELDLILWDKSVSLRGAFGYKDNVLLSSIDRQGSAFWQTALDITLLRANLESGGTLTFFLSGEDRRYFSIESVDREQLLISQAKLEYPFSEEWSASSVLQYMYLDQVFDASATEQILLTLPVKGHNLQFAPTLSRKLPWDSTLEFKFILERQFFNEPLDDYWEFGPQLIFKKSYGHRSEASVAYAFDDRKYDTRQESDLDFEPVPDTSLEYRQHEFELTVDHSFDAERHWRSRSRLLFEISNDGGTGFYDFNRYRLSQRFGYFTEDWQVTLEGKILHYDYDIQPVPLSGDIRSVWEYVVALNAERNIWKKLTLFGDFEHEIVNSTFPLEEYHVITVLGGVDWEF